MWHRVKGRRLTASILGEDRESLREEKIACPISGPFYNLRFGGRGEVILPLIVVRMYTKHGFRTKFLEMIVQSHLILGNKRALNSFGSARILEGLKLTFPLVRTFLYVKMILQIARHITYMV